MHFTSLPKVPKIVFLELALKRFEAGNHCNQLSEASSQCLERGLKLEAELSKWCFLDFIETLDIELKHDTLVATLLICLPAVECERHPGSLATGNICFR